MRRFVALGFVLLLLGITGAWAGGETEAATATSTLEMTILHDAITWTKANLDINESAELEAWQELTNTELTFITPPHANYGEKAQLLFATGDLPDLYSGGPWDRFATDGLLVPLDDYFASAGGQRILSESPLSEEWFPYVSLDGVIYGVPNTRALAGSNQGIMLRKDWLDAVGLPMPESLEDYRRVLNAFTYDDPDGNGQDDTYGITFRKNLSYVFGFGGAFKVNPNHRNLVWDNYDGQLVAQATQQKYKDYLAYMRSLHDDGVFAPGALTGSSDLWKEHMFNSVAGMWFHSITRIDEYFMRNMMKANPDWEARGIEIVMAKPPLADDGRGGPTMGSPVSGPVFITVAAEDPDRVFDYLVNVFTNPEWLEFAKWGLEGKHHLIENGRKVRHPDGLTDDRYLQLKGMVFLQSKYPLDDEDVLYHYGERALRAHQFGAQYNRKPDLSLIGKPVLDEEKEHSNLGDIKLEYSMKIIRGDLPLDEGWDRMQQAMEAAGLPRVQAAVQGWYDANR